MKEEMKVVNEQEVLESQEQLDEQNNEELTSDTVTCEEVETSEIVKAEEPKKEESEEQPRKETEETADTEEEKAISFKMPDSQKVQEFMKEWVPKQVKRVKYSLEYVDLIGERIEIKGIDTINSRRKNKLSKAEYKQKLIAFHHEGVHELGNLMVYHAQLLGGAENLEDLKGFTLRIGHIKSEAFTIGAYELVELARVLKAKGEAEDFNEICNLLGGFIRAYRELLGRMERELSIEGIGEMLEQEENQLIEVQRLKEFEAQQDFERFKKAIEEAQVGQVIVEVKIAEGSEEIEAMETEKVSEEIECVKGSDGSQKREVTEETERTQKREVTEKVQGINERAETEDVEIMEEIEEEVEQQEIEEDLAQSEVDKKEAAIRYIPLHQDK